MITDAIATRLKRDAIVSGASPEDIIGRERIVPDEQMAALKSELLKVPYKKIDPDGDHAAADGPSFPRRPREHTARSRSACRTACSSSVCCTPTIRKRRTCSNSSRGRTISILASILFHTTISRLRSENIPRIARRSKRQYAR